MKRAAAQIISIPGYLSSIASLQNPGPEEATTLTLDQQREINEEISKCVGCYLFPKAASAWITNHLYVAFHVAHLRDIPAKHFGAALALVRSKHEAAASFRNFISETCNWFEREIMGGGTPWTPAIRSQLTKELGRSVVLPPRVDWLALAEAVPKAPRKSRKGGVQTEGGVG